LSKYKAKLRKIEQYQKKLSKYKAALRIAEKKSQALLRIVEKWSSEIQKM
jgi:hypothetical protein